MYTPTNAALVTASRAHWAGFAARLLNAGHAADANYVRQQAGCWTLTSHPSIPLDRTRLALYQRLMQDGQEAADELDFAS